MANNDINTPGNRPSLTQDMRIDDFRQYYWLKEELVQFCRQYMITPTGGKSAIADRIERFLQRGQAEDHDNRPVPRCVTAEGPRVLTLDTVIHAGFVCTQKHRAFFKAVIGPTFHFSTFIQHFFKENSGKTYRDAVNAWHEEEERKKTAGYKTSIAPQFEYNRFMRAFFEDPHNHGKPRQAAIRAWKIKRSKPGDTTYSPDDATAE